MHLMKCENGHIYDRDKFRSCPHCSNIVLEATMMDMAAYSQMEMDTEIPESSLQEDYERIGRRKTVGMLICVSGVMQGDGFMLKEGENDIGRASNMDVALTQEVSISRKKHATIYYDEQNIEFTLKTVNDRNGVLCNGVPVRERKLQDRDELTIGKCKLVFVEAGSIWKMAE